MLLGMLHEAAEGNNPQHFARASDKMGTSGSCASCELHLMPNLFL